MATFKISEIVKTTAITLENELTQEEWVVIPFTPSYNKLTKQVSIIQFGH